MPRRWAFSAILAFALALSGFGFTLPSVDLLGMGAQWNDTGAGDSARILAPLLAPVQEASANSLYLNGDVCDWYGGTCVVYVCSSSPGLVSKSATWTLVISGYTGYRYSGSWYPSGSQCWYSTVYIESYTNVIQVTITCNPDCYDAWVSPYY